MPPQIGWKFDDYYTAAPAATELTKLEGNHLTPGQICAREALQNSFAAANKPDEQVRIRISKIDLVWEEKEKFTNALALQYLAKFLPKFRPVQGQADYFTEGRKILEGLSSLDQPIPILAIEDFNTTGLTGEWTSDKNSHWFSLVEALSRSTKDTGLGSYGDGSLFFAKNSDLRTAIYYTRHEPEGGCYSKAKALGMFPQVEGKASSGRAQFGYMECDKPMLTKPLFDAEAERWIASLGFKLRGPQETGTSIFIVGYPQSLDDIEKAIAEYWWPRWYSDHLPEPQISFCSNGVERSFNPEDEKFAYLIGYKVSYRQNLARAEGEGSGVIESRRDKRRLGYFTFNLQPKSGSSDSPLDNKVALIYDSFVLRYADLSDNPLENHSYYGIFDVNLDDEKVKKIFRLGQNKTHDEFILVQRLQSDQDLGKDAQRYIQDYEKELKIELKKYLRGFLQKPPSEEIHEEWPFMKELDRLFAGRNKPRPPPPTPTPSGPQAVVIQEENAPPELGVCRSFSVKLSEHVPAIPQSIEIHLYCSPVENADYRKSALKLPLKVLDANRKEVQMEDNNFTTEVTLKPKKFIAIADAPPDLKYVWEIRLSKA